MILINEEELSFHLTNGKVSYVFRVMERTGVLEQLYCSMPFLITNRLPF